MDEGSPKMANNVLRQAVISCVKGELQQPYNLGVITREQFVKVCSSVTKEFLKEAAPGQTTLTPTNEAHLRAHTTALLSKQLGAESPTTQSTQRPVKVESSVDVAPAFDTQRDFHLGVDTPGAVLASTDDEVLKYQEHLARLSALTSHSSQSSAIDNPPVVQPVKTHTLAHRPSTPVFHSTEPPRSVPSPAAHQAYLHQAEVPAVPSRAPAPATHHAPSPHHASTARQIHSEIVMYVKKIEELQALVNNHLEACEAAL
eukprot:TRINITY_DN31584_c0_g1_i1.p1 TRINITY_DN31584_c0_g1~~TRINITY_DN31584_c0_g1_i1.p1  ORF type:complete len:258 (+),score=45.06 TRINITY_DN31584_c0_g1_i1:61-834(+)